MNQRIEETILANLLVSEKFARKSLPFLKPGFFQDRLEGMLLEETNKFFSEHGATPTKEILSIELKNRSDISDTELEVALDKIKALGSEETSHDWLIQKTEDFCRRRSIYTAIVDSIAILDGKSKSNLREEAIPKLLQEALNITFDNAVGHDFLKDANSRYDYYTRVEDKIPYGLKELDNVTGGGMYKKSCNVVAAQSGGGKSIFMTHTAAHTLSLGKNVLYITLEMSEERIAERIDANLMKIDVDSIKDLSRDAFLSKVDKIQEKTRGRLFIKEYPTGGAHAGHFRGLIEELKVKQDFVPDLIVVDYLGICASSRMKMGGSINSYTYIKAIAEELRGLAVEYDCAVLSGAQLNRSGYDNSDVDMSSTADSMGIVMTLDFYFALVQIPEMNEQQQILCKVLKNRYGDVSSFALGLNKARMTFFDLEPSAQKNLNGYAPPTKKGGFEKKQSEPASTTEDFDIPMFDRSQRRNLDGSGFKF